MYKRLSFILSGLVALMLACQSLTPTPMPSATPTARPSATLAATRTPSPTATVAKTANVEFTSTVTPTMLPLETWESTIKKGAFMTYGADNSATIVCDRAKKTVGVIHHEFRMSIASPDKVTKLKLATYQEEDQYKLLGLATEFCPMATIKFVARPNFTFGEWSSVLPKNWQYVKVPNLLLKRNDFWGSPVVDPRKVQLSWSIGQVTCSKYAEEPEKKLPKGINWWQDQSYQFIVLEDKLDINALCGNRPDGVMTTWAKRFSLKNGDTSDEVLHLLMSDAITWMLSQSKDDPSLTVQEFLCGGYSNCVQLIIEHNSVGQWMETSLDQFEK